MAKLGKRFGALIEPSASEPVYEVRCQTCEVSFPVGTRTCMYCGERPGPMPLFAQQLQPDPMVDFDPVFVPEGDPSAEPITFEEDEAENPRSSLFRLLANLGWILLFAAVTIYRSCTG